MRSDDFQYYALEFPFPIAYWFRRALDREETRDDIEHLLISTVEFLGVAYLAEYLSSMERDAEIDRELLRILESPPSLGEWRDFIYRFIEKARGNGEGRVLVNLDDVASRQGKKELASLIEWRNGWSHVWPDSDRKQFRATLFAFLQRILLLHKDTLFCPLSAKLNGDLHAYHSVILKGNNPGFSEATIECSDPLETEKVYVASPASRRLLPLHPFLIYSRCDKCSEMHYFHFTRVSGRKMVYASIPGGHLKSSGRELAGLETLLKLARGRVLSPRFLSVPGSFSAYSKQLQAGDMLGPFRIEEFINRGGMAHVYRVTDTGTGSPYALKVLPVDRARDTDALVRFESEMGTLQKLDHPNIIRFHDSGRERGDHFMVLSLVRGRRVDGKLCLDASELPKPCTEREIIALAKQVCAALGYVHARGLVHRDLKPGNILLSEDKAILADFGVAHTRDGPSYTIVGLPAGTPEYMAPEQLAQKDFDERTDLYALGCSIYELATGQPPYKAESAMGVIYAHLHSTPPEIEKLNPQISTGLANITKKLLQKDPARRYQSAEKVYEHLARVEQDPAGKQIIEGYKRPEDLAREEEAIARVKAKYRRSLALYVGMVVLVSGFVLGGVLGGRAVYESWHIRGIARSVGAIIESNPLAGLDAAARIEEALIANPHHPRVDEFVKSARSVARLRIRTEPEGRKIDAVHDAKASAHLGFQGPDGPLEGKSGEWLAMPPGYYLVSVDGLTDPFPVLLAWDLAVKEPDGKWSMHRQAPAKLRWESSSPGKIVLGRAVDIFIQIPPPPPPPEMRYVPPGPHYAADHRESDAREVLHDASRDSDPLCKQKVGPAHYEIQTEAALLLHPMETGYWMGVHEVTVGDFAPWFRRHRKDIVDWLAGIKVRHLTNSFTREIPPEEIRRAGAYEAQARFWNRYADSFEAYLASVAVDRLPVVNVPLPIALAYARTHASPRAGELVRWLHSRLSEARGAMTQLEAAAAEIAGSLEVFVPESRLPDSPRLWVTGNCQIDILPVGYLKPLEAYHRWLTQESGFACEMPLEALREHGKKQPDLFGEGRLEEILSRLRDEPHLFVEDDPGALQLRNHFFEAGDQGTVDRKHLVRWLDAEKDDLRSLSRVLEGILDDVDRMPAEAEVISAEIPWHVRLEYGFDLGWTLPTGAMFEKAFRGADDRKYPWGDELRYLSVFASQFEEPQPVTSASDDVSPYGIFGLAGNVSEWTIEPCFNFRDHYARGGCFWVRAEKAVADRIVKMDSGAFTKWIGFRVAREHLPPEKYKRQSLDGIPSGAGNRR